MSRADSIDPADLSVEAIVSANQVGLFAMYQGDPLLAKDRHLVALRRARAAGAAENIPGILHDLCGALVALHDFDAAQAAAEEALTLRREQGRPFGIAHALDAMADLALARGDAKRASQLWQDVSRILLAEGSLVDGLWSAVSAAEAWRRVPDIQRALHQLERPLGEALATKDLALLNLLLETTALVITDAGRRVEATMLLATVERMRSTGGYSGTWGAEYERCVARLRAFMPRREFARAWARGGSLVSADVVSLAKAACQRALATS